MKKILVILSLFVSTFLYSQSDNTLEGIDTSENNESSRINSEMIMNYNKTEKYNFDVSINYNRDLYILKNILEDDNWEIVNYNQNYIKIYKEYKGDFKGIFFLGSYWEENCECKIIKENNTITINTIVLERKNDNFSWITKKIGDSEDCSKKIIKIINKKIRQTDAR